MAPPWGPLPPPKQEPPHRVGWGGGSAAWRVQAGIGLVRLSFQMPRLAAWSGVGAGSGTEAGRGRGVGKEVSMLSLSGSGR